MGLAIARQVARGHGGDVTIAARGGTDDEPTTVLATIPGGVLDDDA
jgi:two-component system CitB family sensor kinase